MAVDDEHPLRETRRCGLFSDVQTLKTALRDLELMLWRRRRHADVAVLINTHDFIKGLVILRYREHQFRFGIEFHIRCPHCIDGSSDLRVVLIGDLEQDS